MESVKYMLNDSENTSITDSELTSEVWDSRVLSLQRSQVVELLVRKKRFISYLKQKAFSDYAIQIFYDALQKGKHTCYLRPDTRLPMMYDTDCMASIIQLLSAESETLKRRTYNVTGFSFTPEEIADAIRRVIPSFEIDYDICPTRQAIGKWYTIILSSFYEWPFQLIHGQCHWTTVKHEKIGDGIQSTDSKKQFKSCSHCWEEKKINRQR